MSKRSKNRIQRRPEGGPSKFLTFEERQKIEMTLVFYLTWLER